MSLDQEVAILARMPALEGFEPDALRLLAFAARRIDYRVGALLFDMGEPADGAIAILSGRVGLVNEALESRRSVGAGDLLDEMAMYVDTERLERAEAIEPTVIITLTRDIVRRVLVEFPGSAAEIRNRLSGRLDRLSHEIGQVAERLVKLDEA